MPASGAFRQVWGPRELDYAVHDLAGKKPTHFGSDDIYILGYCTWVYGLWWWMVIHGAWKWLVINSDVSG